MLFIVTLNDL